MHSLFPSFPAGSVISSAVKKRCTCLASVRESCDLLISSNKLLSQGSKDADKSNNSDDCSDLTTASSSYNQTNTFHLCSHDLNHFNIFGNFTSSTTFQSNSKRWGRYKAPLSPTLTLSSSSFTSSFSSQHRVYTTFNMHRPSRYRLAWFPQTNKGHGWPMMWVVTSTKPSWQPHLEEEYETIARDEYGVPMQIPPELSTMIKHTYHVPPQFYPFLKKLGDDTPELQPYTEKLIRGDFTREDYEEMFYSFAKPLKIHRNQIAMPYRTPEEMERSDEVHYEGAWLSYRQRVQGEYASLHIVRDWIICVLMSGWITFLWVQQTRYYRISNKLFYLDAPEHKINWVKPRGDVA